MLSRCRRSLRGTTFIHDVVDFSFAPNGPATLFFTAGRAPQIRDDRKRVLRREAGGAPSTA